MVIQNLKIYGGIDPRSIPCYSVAEAAQHTRVPARTLRTWISGRSYPQGTPPFNPLIVIPAARPLRLSFTNLVELYILGVIRQRYGISIPKVRNALSFLRGTFHSDHPLAEQIFLTDGIDLFVHQADLLINVSKKGQLAFREVIEPFLKRIEHDKSGSAFRLYPLVRGFDANQPCRILIDPLISFGRPVLADTGVPTAVIAERYKAGDNIEFLSKDYHCSNDLIQEAIRYELSLAA